MTENLNSRSFPCFRYQTEFGFTIPGRPIIVDDVRIRGVGKAFSETEKLIEQSSGPPRVETVSTIESEYMVTCIIVNI